MEQNDHSGQSWFSTFQNCVTKRWDRKWKKWLRYGVALNEFSTHTWPQLMKWISGEVMSVAVWCIRWGYRTPRHLHPLYIVISLRKLRAPPSRPSQQILWIFINSDPNDLFARGRGSATSGLCGREDIVGHPVYYQCCLDCYCTTVACRNVYKCIHEVAVMVC